MFRGVGLAALAFAFLLPLSSYAGSVTEVKGRSMRLNMDSEQAQVGDLYFLLSADGKKKAIVKITKTKGNQAIATLLKGKADVGMTTLKREGGAPQQAGGGGGGGGGRSTVTRSGLRKAYWGGILGFSMDSMSVDLPATTTGQSAQSVSMTGSSFSLLGIFDYMLFNRGWFRGEAGYQGFSVAGSSVCGAATTCNMSASYIDLNLIFRYLFTDGNFRPWLGGGFGLMFPAAKSSTALDTGSISSTGIFIFTGGLDWSLSPNMYVPISIEYGMFPKSSTVSASWITLRAGIAVPF
jgi:hypothetical protein